MKEKCFYQTQVSDSNLKIHFFYLVLIAVFILIPQMKSFSQNECGIKIFAQNNRSIKTISNSEYTYTLYIENSGDSGKEVQVSAENYNSACENPDGMPTASNIDLLIQLLDQDNNAIEGAITVGPGEKVLFLLKLSVPEASNLDTWNCTQVQATPSGCEPVTLVLHTFNPNPENME